ncbi:prephenate dehydratase domain-containing protein [Corynebacterium bovis]|uniref:prephenate dehydratase domain-containing protein n=1 Tax=Corynebacterium bovis TaxID=36808 RepID=UPI00244D3E6C|nr:prephenate dehydratase domain-containing protein [Corynebacterium bovis]MDH2456300.1 prephenate dehydratase domain-containing protein [Corynebacterium bovis]
MQESSASSGERQGRPGTGGRPVVTYLGPRGTFTEQALHRFIDAGHVPADADLRPVDSPAAAIRAVREGSADMACVALENSVDGPVVQTFDALAGVTAGGGAGAGPTAAGAAGNADAAGTASSVATATAADALENAPGDVRILRETDVPVEFAVLVRPGTAAADVRTVTTHPVAMAQVRGWMERELPGAQFIPASSNGAAAAAVAAGEADAAAAPLLAAGIHGLDALAEGVADVRGANTRFVLVGRPGAVASAGRTGRDRTAVVFSLPNHPAALWTALSEIAMRDVDMSRIESRPTRTGLGTYMFHVELVGHVEDDAVADALAGLHRRTDAVRFLGSWPQSGGTLHEDAGGSGGRVPPDLTASRRWVTGLREGPGHAPGAGAGTAPGADAPGTDAQGRVQK